ncbi:hypothetical protein VNO80_00383 [Phaseolus coccineus]|uniref:Uncharacterized protein n=1 Tax=Phaseolus coccineus TaxID=3886 RepID=A0AAN9NZY6_PHACN
MFFYVLTIALVLIFMRTLFEGWLLLLFGGADFLVYVWNMQVRHKSSAATVYLCLERLSNPFLSRTVPISAPGKCCWQVTPGSEYAWLTAMFSKAAPNGLGASGRCFLVDAVFMQWIGVNEGDFERERVKSGVCVGLGLLFHGECGLVRTSDLHFFILHKLSILHKLQTLQFSTLHFPSPLLRSLA